jgi:hypothetical protein
MLLHAKNHHVNIKDAPFQKNYRDFFRVADF